MLEVQKSLLFKEISQNHIKAAIELLNKEPKLIFSTTKDRKNIFHVLLENGHASSFNQLFFSTKTQADRRVLFTRIDIFEQNVLHYAGKHGDRNIFKMIFIDLWEHAVCTLRQVNSYNLTPIQLANANTVFTTQDKPIYQLTEENLFLALEARQVNIPWHEEKLNQIHNLNFNAKNHPIEFFTDYFGSNVLHCLSMYCDIELVQSTIPLLKDHAKELARQVNNFGNIPIQLVWQNPYECRSDTFNKLSEITMTKNSKEKSIEERNIESLNLFFDMLCTDTLNKDIKSEIILEINLFADNMTTYSDLDVFIKGSGLFKKLHNLNVHLLKNLIISVKINTFINYLTLDSNTTEQYNLLSEEQKEKTNLKITILRSNNYSSTLKSSLLQWQLYSFNINKNKSRSISASIHLKAANCGEHASIVAKFLEIIEYDPPYTIINAYKGDHVLVSLSTEFTDDTSNLNKPKTCSTNIVLLDAHTGIFSPAYYLPQRLKTRIFFPPRQTNILCSYNPSYHRIGVKTFFSKNNRSQNPLLSAAHARLTAIQDLFSFVNNEIDSLTNNDALIPQKVKKKEALILHKKHLKSDIEFLKRHYKTEQALTEKDIDQINHLISHYIHALYRITQRPILPIYPRKLFTHTRWNGALQSILNALGEIRQKLEKELFTWGTFWQQPASKNNPAPSPDCQVKQSSIDFTQ